MRKLNYEKTKRILDRFDRVYEQVFNRIRQHIGHNQYFHFYQAVLTVNCDICNQTRIVGVKTAPDGSIDAYIEEHGVPGGNPIDLTDFALDDAATVLDRLYEGEYNTQPCRDDKCQEFDSSGKPKPVLTGQQIT
jgi:hypothetical protein